MLGKRSLVAVALMAVAAAFSGCAKVAESATETPKPYTLEELEGGINRLTLTGKAAENMRLATEQVRQLVRFGSTPRTSVPYAAVLYEAKGTTFVYASPKPLTFERHPITVDYIEGDRAVLSEGPPVGTAVVTTGGAELTGIEFGSGK